MHAARRIVEERSAKWVHPYTGAILGVPDENNLPVFTDEHGVTYPAVLLDMTTAAMLDRVWYGATSVRSDRRSSPRMDWAAPWSLAGRLWQRPGQTGHRATNNKENSHADVLPNAQLLHECAEALERLLASPDLQLDCLEQPTRDAIAHAHSVLEKVSARRQAVYCVLCGELLPDVSFTDEDRGQLVAYAHRACADKAAQSADSPE